MVNDADGSEYPTRAVFDEVRPPELLVWTESHSGMRVRSEFVALGPDRTEVRIHQTYVPEAFSGARGAGGVRVLARPLRGVSCRVGLMSAGEATRWRRTSPPNTRRWPICWSAAGPAVWDAPSLCEGWRTREVVAHMTMPARY